MVVFFFQPSAHNGGYDQSLILLHWHFALKAIKNNFMCTRVFIEARDPGVVCIITCFLDVLKNQWEISAVKQNNSAQHLAFGTLAILTSCFAANAAADPYLCFPLSFLSLSFSLSFYLCLSPASVLLFFSFAAILFCRIYKVPCPSFILPWWVLFQNLERNCSRKNIVTLIVATIQIKW